MIDLNDFPEFIADCDFQAIDSTMVSFKKGDRLAILYSDAEWWYAKMFDTGAEGWLPPTFGHIDDSMVTPLQMKGDINSSHLSEGGQFHEREKILQDMMASEKSFVTDLKVFIDIVINAIEIRDTSFKRNFLNDSSLALSFNLLREIFIACKSFLEDLRSIRIDAENRPKLIETSFTQFAPSLRIFGQFATENSNSLDALKNFTKPLNEFLKQNPLPIGTEIEKYFLLPVQHYNEYLIHFEKYVSFFRDGKDDISSLYMALDMLKAYTFEVDEQVEAEKSKLILLAIQSQCKFLHTFSCSR